MGLFEHPEFSQHEQVSYFSDPATGLRSIIAIHNSRGSVAGGGIRFFPYQTSDDALRDGSSVCTSSPQFSAQMMQAVFFHAVDSVAFMRGLRKVAGQGGVQAG